MAVGNYGTKRLSSVSITDIEVLYSYVGDRGTEPTNNFKFVDGGGITTLNQPDGDTLPGYFNLKFQV